VLVLVVENLNSRLKIENINSEYPIYLIMETELKEETRLDSIVPPNLKEEVSASLQNTLTRESEAKLSTLTILTLEREKYTKERLRGKILNEELDEFNIVNSEFLEDCFYSFYEDKHNPPSGRTFKTGTESQLLLIVVTVPRAPDDDKHLVFPFEFDSDSWGTSTAKTLLEETSLLTKALDGSLSGDETLELHHTDEGEWRLGYDYDGKQFIDESDVDSYKTETESEKKIKQKEDSLSFKPKLTILFLVPTYLALFVISDLPSIAEVAVSSVLYSLGMALIYMLSRHIEARFTTYSFIAYIDSKIGGGVYD
jgi:hypothetical protein